jgi:hypothetical protein
MHWVCHETFGLHRQGREALVHRHESYILIECLGSAVSFIQFSQLPAWRPTPLDTATSTRRKTASDSQTVFGRSAY